MLMLCGLLYVSFTMPPPKTKKEKEDIADKVKEIRQRQQNWLKQRTASIERESTKSPQPGQSAQRTRDKPQPAKVEVHNSKKTNQKCSSPSNASSDSRGRFQHWMQARNTSEDDKREEAARQTYNKLPGNNQRESTNLVTSKETVSRPLSPDKFDALAEHIIGRVRNELGLKDGGGKTSKHHPYDNSLDDEQDPLQKSGNTLDSHYCPACHKSMVPPHHSPMLVIPCGHTFCESCIHDETRCLQCHCTINSLTCNIMLQQIIMDFKNQKKRPAGSSHNSQPTRSRIHNSNYQAYRESVTDYREEYETLQTRCEVLDSESQSIQENMSEISERIAQERRTEDTISEEEDRIRAEISRLQSQLDGLSEDRAQSQHRCEMLALSRQEQQNKLVIVQDTLGTLRKQMDKVALLIDS